MTQIMAAIRYGTVRILDDSPAVATNTQAQNVLNSDTFREPLPVEMFWLPKPERPCLCEDCDEYLWFHNDAPVM